MSLLHLARRLLCASGLIMIAAICVSVMTHDAWLMAGHAAGVASAVVAAGAVLALVVAGLRGIAGTLPPPSPDDAELAPYKRRLTGLEAETDPGRPWVSDGPLDR